MVQYCAPGIVVCRDCSNLCNLKDLRDCKTYCQEYYEKNVKYQTTELTEHTSHSKPQTTASVPTRTKDVDNTWLPVYILVPCLIAIVIVGVIWCIRRKWENVQPRQQDVEHQNTRGSNGETNDTNLELLAQYRSARGVKEEGQNGPSDFQQPRPVNIRYSNESGGTSDSSITGTCRNPPSNGKIITYPNEDQTARKLIG